MLGEIGRWSWFVVWALLLIVASLFVYLGLGGAFIVLGLALVYALATGFNPLTWQWLLILAGLALFGELVEFVIGTFYVARKGATRSGVIAAFGGGLAGAGLGNSVFPVVGAVLGSFVGAFAGAVLGEYRQNQKLEPSLRVGGHAFLGRIVAMMVKHIIALIMVILILRVTLP